MCSGTPSQVQFSHPPPNPKHVFILPTEALGLEATEQSSARGPMGGQSLSCRSRKGVQYQAGKLKAAGWISWAG